MYPQWSSLHEERTKIIQEGLLNPSADILEAMTEIEAVHTGKTLLLTNFNSVILQLELFFNTFSFQCSFFFIDFTSKPIESLEQITAFHIEKLLSKSAILSGNLLLQLWQSLTK